MKAYYVYYVMHPYENRLGIMVPAKNKVDAYDKAVFKLIPQKHDGSLPYSAWVHSVTYNNGNYHEFNTCDGLPY